MVKFNLNYQVSIETNSGDFKVIEYPLTFKFQVTRGTVGVFGNAKFDIYNLNEKTQREIQKDYHSAARRVIEVRAGYDKDLSVIFRGYVSLCQTQRQGVDTITTIECIDGYTAYDTTSIEITVNEGQSYQSVVNLIAEEIAKTGVKIGAISQFTGEFQRGQTLSGNPISLLQEYVSGLAFIDNNTLNIIKNGETISNSYALIDSSTGLLNSPSLSGNIVELETIFEPRILAGQKVAVVSDIRKDLNNVYRVITVSHSGTISGAVSSQCITAMVLTKGDFRNV